MKIDRVKFWSLCTALAFPPCAALACGGSGHDGTAAGGSDLSAAATATNANAPSAPSSSPSPVIATVTTKSITKKTATCEVDVEAPVVSIPANKDMETAINHVLSSVAFSSCTEGGGDIHSKFTVTANGSDLLSIRVTGDAFSTGAAHANALVDTFNFDLKNGGKRLKLTDVLTATGMQKEIATCGATLDAKDGDAGFPAEEGSSSESSCQASLTPQPEFSFEPQWVATSTGLEVEADVSHAEGDFESSTVAWRDLVTDGLNPSVVLDFGQVTSPK